MREPRVGVSRLLRWMVCVCARFMVAGGNISSTPGAVGGCRRMDVISACVTSFSCCCCCLCFVKDVTGALASRQREARSDPLLTRPFPCPHAAHTRPAGGMNVLFMFA
ncbi:unnamed protein product, partial [Ectocarpus sp. 12 AP-2014]